MNDLITQRLVHMTFALLDETAGWLARLGMEVRRREEQTITVRNPFLNISTALLAGTDPITRAVCLATVLCGMHWVQVFPTLLTRVNREWRRKRLAQDQQADSFAENNPPDRSGRKRRSSARPPASAPTFTELYKEENPGEQCCRGSIFTSERSYPMATQFLEILFSEEVQPEDLTVLAPATLEKPGRVRLAQARLGPAHPAAPNSAPLFSRTRAKIGFVAAAGLIELPFSGCYWIEPGESDQPSASSDQLLADG